MTISGGYNEKVIRFEIEFQKSNFIKKIAAFYMNILHSPSNMCSRKDLRAEKFVASASPQKKRRIAVNEASPGDDRAGDDRAGLKDFLCSDPVVQMPYAQIQC